VTRTLARLAEGFCAPAPDPAYVSLEEERLARSAAKKTRDAAQAPRPRDERLGLWQNLSIASIQQALNLIEWMDQGDDSAYEMFRFLVQNASAEPGAFRTKGENHIIVHQGRLDRDWWITTRGAARAPHSELNLSSCAERHPHEHHRCAPVAVR
jgi:hypothetical protein